MGRESDIRPAAIMADDTTTEFVFTIPQRDPSEDQLNDESSLHAAEQADDIRNDSNRIEGLEDALLEEPLDLRFDEIDRNEAEDPETEVEAFDDKDRASQDLSLLDTSMLNTTTQEINVTTSKKSNIIRKKVKVSKHGIQYPSLPAGVVKKLALTYARTAGNSKAKINKETLDAIMQATDWFFEQVSDDLGAYATHAGRKTIDESDIVTLMAR
jgi:histone H3/H4